MQATMTKSGGTFPLYRVTLSNGAAFVCCDKHSKTMNRRSTRFGTTVEGVTPETDESFTECEMYRHGGCR
jgi:hypothetical protein